MTADNLVALAGEHLAVARAASSGRSAHTLFGGHEHSLRQTIIALTAGQRLDEHESPGDATLQVLSGRVRLRSGDESWEGVPADLLAIPPSRHSLDAIEDSVILLSVAKKIPDPT